jgi:surface polysaccharide O-acyltransferase-like enzyme
MFYKDINLFRALAIFFVVSAHCLSIPIFNFKDDSIQYHTIVYLFSGSTSFFVFILGFLFFAKFNDNNNFNYIFFLQKKLKFVFSPYLFFSQIDIIYYSVISLFSYILGRYYDKSLLIGYPYFSALFYGDSRIPIGLWFIPVVMIIYLILPIVVFFVKASRFKKLFCVIISTFIASLVHRNFDNHVFGLLSNVVYFFPFLILGVFFSVDYSYLTKRSTWIVYIALSLIALIAFLFQCEIDHIIDFNGDLVLSNFDFMVYQKISLTVLLFLVFSRLKDFNISLIHNLGKYSFGIFFIHGIVVFIISLFFRHINFSHKTDSLLIYLLISIFVMMISFSIVLIIRKILGKNSKFVIGC